MRGRLRAKSKFWEKFCRKKKVLQWVMTGFRIILDSRSAASGLAEKSRIRQTAAAFVGEAVRELVLTSTAIAVPEQPHCVLPLGVVCRSGSGKKRLILDARYINDRVVMPSFKYETLTGLQHVRSRTITRLQ